MKIDHKIKKISGFEISTTTYSDYLVGDEKTVEGYSAPFAIRDIINFSDSKRVFEINRFVRKYAEKGTGVKVITNFCKGFSEVVMLLASPLSGEIEEYPDNDVPRDIWFIDVIKLTSYYKLCGFLDISKTIESEYGNVMIFNNEAGRETIRRLNE